MTVSVVLLALAVVQSGTQQLQVVIDPPQFELAVDSSRRLRAFILEPNGGREPATAVRWLVSDRSIVTVSDDGLVTARRPGRAQVIAVVRGNPTFSAVTVPHLPPATIEVRIPTQPLLAGTSVPLTVVTRDRLGEELAAPPLQLRSESEHVVAVDAAGRIFARSPGAAAVEVAAGEVTTRLDVRVVRNEGATYDIVPARASVRTGDVLRLRVRGMTGGGREIAELWPAWTVSGPGAQVEAEGHEGVFVAEHAGTYRVSALIGEDLVRSAIVRVEPRALRGLLEKVGRGPIATHHSGDMWVFQGIDGRDYAHIGTFMHDWMKAWDVTDPSLPVLVDSIRVDARRINDVKIHPNNRLAVITREGASDRRNGIVLLDLTDPAHPTILAEYTESLTGGVHNVWIRGEENLVYACHNGTSELHIIDIADPTRPREIGRWGLPKQDKTLHDVIVQDGYAYLSYWDDGVVMLDVGAGTHGGTPTVPVLVSQFKYPIGHTHTAWRSGRYLFVGDEIYPSGWDADAPIEARGYVHVLDYDDPAHPREVARYEIPEAGAHNLWVEGDRLYIGYYQAGLRVVDISGELRGDLYRQGREIAALKTLDGHSTVPNWPMTWGAQVYKGNIFTADMNSGLWIARLIEERPVP